MSDLERWRKANPWILQNTQNGNAMSGRYPTKESAVDEANKRGGVISISGNVVFFSEMPLL